MPRVDLQWLGEHVELPENLTAEELAQALVKVGIEEETIHSAGIAGPLAIGQVKQFERETHSNGKTISWCQVDVGEPELRGIVCGAPNIRADQKVVVALPGAILPGGFEISARKTYGHISDGMICSERELGLSDEHEGILDITETDAAIGSDAKAFLGLNYQVLEVNITPDRGYEYSYRGIGREYHHSTGAKFIDKVSELKTCVPAVSDSAFQVILDDQAPIRDVLGCNRFATRLVEGVDPQAPSPKWLQDYLTRSGMRSISLAVDISNYVMLDLGQPIHCYDYETLFEPIVVRRAQAGETLVTLDNQERTLDPEDLLITDSPSGPGSRIIGLAGTMGGLDTEITDSTSKILIEAAYFEPVTVARTAKRHKLPSEASRRFERGIDTDLQAAAAQLCVDLLVKYGGPNVQVSNRVGDINIQVPAAPVTFNPAKVQTVLGLNLPATQIQSILEDIGCHLTADNRRLKTDNWLMTTPSWRPDLRIDEDFLEEIARIVGYDQIGLEIPAPHFSAEAYPGLTKRQRAVRHLSNSLSANGFTEVITYPFVGRKTLSNLTIDPADPRSYLVKLANPLAGKKSYLRSELLQTLLDTVQHNVFRDNTNLRLYEIGHTYLADPNSALQVPDLPAGVPPTEAQLAEINAGLPAQPLKLAGVLHGETLTKTPISAARSIDWTAAIELLPILESALHKKLHLVQTDDSRQTTADRSVVDVRRSADVSAHSVQDLAVTNSNADADSAELVARRYSQISPFHPTRVAAISTSTKIIGVIGELHPRVCKNLHLQAHTVAFEINLSGWLIDQGSEFFSVQPLSRYPAVKQDFSFLAPADLPVHLISDRITQLLPDELESLTLIDIYQGERISEGLKSVTYSLKIRSLNQTLNPEQIEKIRARIIGELNIDGVRLRD